LDGPVSRARDRNVAIAIVGVVAVAFAVMIAISLRERLDRDDHPVVPPASDDVPTAGVYLSEEEACEAFADTRGKRQRNEADATADADDLADEYLSGDDGPARLVVVGRCDGSFVVSLGLDSIHSVVPAKGPRGTPVLAYFQALIVPQ
jgi:hypothetical protein